MIKLPEDTYMECSVGDCIATAEIQADFFDVTIYFCAEHAEEYVRKGGYVTTYCDGCEDPGEFKAIAEEESGDALFLCDQCILEDSEQLMEVLTDEELDRFEDLLDDV